MWRLLGLLAGCERPEEAFDAAVMATEWEGGGSQAAPPAPDPSLIPSCLPTRKAFVNGVGYATFSDALAASGPGAVVQLCPGVHVGAPAVVNYPAYLIGMTGDRDDVEIEGGSMYGPYFPRVRESQFGLANLTFRDYQGVVNPIWMSGDSDWAHLLVRNVKFKNVFPGVMNLSYSTSADISDSFFEDDGFIVQAAGGAIGQSVSDPNIVIEDSVFTRNCSFNLFNFGPSGIADTGYVRMQRNLFVENTCSDLRGLIFFDLDDDGTVVRFRDNLLERNVVLDAVVDFHVAPPTTSDIVMVGDRYIANETGNTILRIGEHIPPPSPSMVNNVSYLGELQFHNNVVADAMVEVHRRHLTYVRNSDFGVGPTDNVVVDEEVEIAGCAGWYRTFDNPVWLYLNGHRSTCRLFTSPP